MEGNKANTITKDFFNDIYPLSERSFLELKAIFKTVLIPKDEVFIKVGKRNSSEYFIVNGFCRSFLENTDGEEITLSFFKTRSVLPPQIIRTKGMLSLLNFHALTDVELIEFDAARFLALMIENIEIRDFGNMILLNELVKKTEKEIALVSLTAKERLIKFRMDYSILENLISHSIIASYLGITNVSLSRLRGEIIKG